jgi:uncharacterized protein
MQFQQAKEFIVKKLTEELPPKLSYHSIEHINDVYGACEHLAKEEGVEGDQLVLLLTAALYHDSGFLIQSKDHETLSCDIVRTHLPAFQYSGEQIEIICGMIIATRLPQSPKNKLEEILCDADLDYLGREDFYQIGNRLFEEFSVEGIVNNEEEWNHVQLKFLESHTYFTNTAIKLRKQKKDDHLRQIRTKVKTYS